MSRDQKLYTTYPTHNIVRITNRTCRKNVVYNKQILNFGWKRLKERFRVTNVEVDGNRTDPKQPGVKCRCG
jgi:hypothetical protein